MPETQTKQSTQQVALSLDSSTADQLLDQGVSPDDLIAAIRYRAQEKSRTVQQNIPAPPTQPDDHWAERKAWLLDGQPIYGELSGFYFPALAALRADNQAEFSRQRDLLFKAVRTFVGEPPPEIKLPQLEGANHE